MEAMYNDATHLHDDCGARRPSLFDDRFYIRTALRSHIQFLADTSLPGGKELVLLDFGCGGTPYRSIFEPKVRQYIGVDVPGNPVASIHASPDAQLPLPDAFADVVLSTQVLEHVDNPTRYLGECHRVLKLDGVLILSTHGYWMYHPDPCDYWRWTKTGLTKLIAQSGYRIVNTYGIMSLAATGLQLFQDGLWPKVPRLLKPTFACLMQSSIWVLERLRAGRSSQDACIFVVVAAKAVTV